MVENSFYFWLLAGLLVVGLLAGLAQMFGRTSRKQPYNYAFEKQTAKRDMTEYKALYPQTRALLQELNLLKLKKLEAGSYDLETRTILARLPECSSVQDVFNVIDEEFYRWHGHSPLFAEFYDGAHQAAAAIWAQYQKQG